MEELLKQLIEQMDIRFDKIDTNIRFLQEDVSVIKEEVTVIKEEVAVIKETVSNNLSENRSNFKHVVTNLNDQQRIFKVVEDELKKVNIDIEYLSSKAGKHDVQLNNINKRIQS